MGIKVISGTNEVTRKREVIKFAQLGLTNTQIASSIGVSVTAIHRMIQRDPSLRKIVEALRSKAIQDLLESSLIRRAVGYTDTETTEEWVDDTGTITKKITTKTKHIPPDINAINTLANKYAPELGKRSNESKEVNVKMTLTASRAMSLEDRQAIILADARRVDEGKLLKGLGSGALEAPLIADIPVNPVGGKPQNFTQNSKEIENRQLSTEGVISANSLVDTLRNKESSNTAEQCVEPISRTYDVEDFDI